MIHFKTMSLVKQQHLQALQEALQVPVVKMMSYLLARVVMLSIIAPLL